MEFVVVLIVAVISAVLVLGVIRPRLARRAHEPDFDTDPFDLSTDDVRGHNRNVRERARSVQEEAEDLSGSDSR